MAVRSVPTCLAAVAVAMAATLGAGTASGQPRAREAELAPWQTRPPTDPLFPMGATFTVLGASAAVAGATVLLVDSSEGERLAAHGSLAGGAALAFIGGLAWASATSGSVSDPRLWEAPRRRVAGAVLTGIGFAAIGAGTGMVVSGSLDGSVDRDAVIGGFFPGIAGLGMAIPGVILWATSEDTTTWADIAIEREVARRTQRDGEETLKKKRQKGKTMRNAGIGLIVAGVVVGSIGAVFAGFSADARGSEEETFGIMGAFCGVLGGASLITGVPLTAVGASRAGAEAEPTVNVDFGPGGGRVYGSF